LLTRIKADLLDLNVAMGSNCKVVDNGLEDRMCVQANRHRKLQIRHQKEADDAIVSEWYERAKRLQAHFQQEDRKEEQQRLDTLALVEGMRP
jgi:hypothetical protein